VRLYGTNKRERQTDRQTEKQKKKERKKEIKKERKKEGLRLQKRPFFSLKVLSIRVEKSTSAFQSSRDTSKDRKEKYHNDPRMIKN